MKDFTLKFCDRCGEWASPNCDECSGAGQRHRNIYAVPPPEQDRAPGWATVVVLGFALAAAAGTVAAVAVTAVLAVLGAGQ